MARPATRKAGGRSGRGGFSPAALRQLHAYIGAFIAPSVLFFALTGSLQLFSLHEAHGDYTPPPLIEKLSAVHKDQVFSAKSDHDAPKAPAAGHAGAQAQTQAEPEHEHHHPKALAAKTVALKWLFLAVAAGLITSTCIGVWMALTFARRKAVIWTLLVVGAALPILLLAL